MTTDFANRFGFMSNSASKEDYPLAKLEINVKTRA
jgi:hypothetical protein